VVKILSPDFVLVYPSITINYTFPFSFTHMQKVCLEYTHTENLHRRYTNSENYNVNFFAEWNSWVESDQSSFYDNRVHT